MIEACNCGRNECVADVADAFTHAWTKNVGPHVSP